MKTPYIGFGNDTLKKQPILVEGQLVPCPHCKGAHELKCGTSNNRKVTLLMFYKCGNSTYLAAVEGRSVMNVKSDVSGEI